MKKHLFWMTLIGVVIATTTLVAVYPATAENVQEFLLRVKNQEAEVVRAKLPVYAATCEAVLDGKLEGVMPAEVLDATKYVVNSTGKAFIIFEGQEVAVEGHKDFITFTVSVTAVWETDGGGTGIASSVDPVEGTVWHVSAARSVGLVFYEKTINGKTETISAVPGLGNFLMGDKKIREIMWEHDLVPPPSYNWKTNKAEVIKGVIKKRGKNGVLTRAAVIKWQEEKMGDFRYLMTTAGGGYIKPTKQGGYELATPKY
jgi:hypothetical protein